MNTALKDLLVNYQQVIDLLMNGSVGVMPTDTVYGLVARAHDKQAVAKLYALKNREHKPGTIIAASVEQLRELGVSQAHLDKVKQWWPNSLSVETPLSADLNYLHQETGRQGLRVVADKNLQAILLKTGPLLTSSANHPGKPGAANVQDAWNYFGDRVDFYVDGGDLSDRAPSTIIKITDDGAIEVIRDGAVKIDSVGPNL
jgi:L-threonylcarbamoyladenylate synthase